MREREWDLHLVIGIDCGIEYLGGFLYSSSIQLPIRITRFITDCSALGIQTDDLFVKIKYQV